ncbi:MAG: PEP/pyruvate-binding domain-containing protein, partial [Bacteroidia bacterium]
MSLITAHVAIAQGLSKEDIGGKAFHLLEMYQADLPLPPFLILPRRTLASILLPIRSEMEKICDGLTKAPEQELARSAQQLKQMILSLQINPTEIAQIHKTCRAFFGKTYKLAVRSSGIGEDGQNTSFAGIHETELYVDKANLATSILSSLSSAWSFPALAYRLANDLSLSQIQYAIVLQQMIPATRSGVSFSMNLQGNMADMLIVAGFGLGEGIVSDQVETDAFVIDRQSKTIQTQINPKSSQVGYEPDQGLHLQALSEELRDQAVLSEQEVLTVSDFTFRAEQLLQQPADIEFSFDEHGKFHMLQMRPISTIKADELHILDNTNIVESYPGISLPLSFSFALNAYEKVFKGASKAFWVSDKKIERYSEVLSHLLAHAYGRVYYRLDNWYRMMALVYSSKSSLD